MDVLWITSSLFNCMSAVDVFSVGFSPLLWTDGRKTQVYKVAFYHHPPVGPDNM